ncbi:hypothetical protein AJ88_23835 [Mesorhizobium amorphae CCBAU 01583]|nr:hypothetical protein AJ88_23835 [Mesorhizobium amorphae CCBAU 01583]
MLVNRINDFRFSVTKDQGPSAQNVINVFVIVDIPYAGTITSIIVEGEWSPIRSISTRYTSWDDGTRSLEESLRPSI